MYIRLIQITCGCGWTTSVMFYIASLHRTLYSGSLGVSSALRTCVTCLWHVYLHFTLMVEVVLYTICIWSCRPGHGYLFSPIHTTTRETCLHQTYLNLHTCTLSAFNFLSCFFISSQYLNIAKKKQKKKSQATKWQWHDRTLTIMGHVIKVYQKIA